MGPRAGSRRAHRICYRRSAGARELEDQLRGAEEQLHAQQERLRLAEIEVRSVNSQLTGTIYTNFGREERASGISLLCVKKSWYLLFCGALSESVPFTGGPCDGT